MKRTFSLTRPPPRFQGGGVAEAMTEYLTRWEGMWARGAYRSACDAAEACWRCGASVHPAGRSGAPERHLTAGVHLLPQLRAYGLLRPANGCGLWPGAQRRSAPPCARWRPGGDGGRLPAGRPASWTCPAERRLTPDTNWWCSPTLQVSGSLLPVAEVGACAGAGIFVCGAAQKAGSVPSYGKMHSTPLLSGAQGVLGPRHRRLIVTDAQAGRWTPVTAAPAGLGSPEMPELCPTL
jgi:hypothetical protein